ncbi:MAG: GNAT family N-acetyltransferase [Chloroflexota bacterium]|nr:GNAT family N-acetyltransferase [Chloroflexota bacterium]
MPVQPPRRLAPPTAVSLYDEISRAALSCGPSRTEVTKTERDYPQLVLRDGDNILAGLAGSGLAYAFESERAFIERFPAMFEALLPKIRRELHTDTVRFRLTHNPARPIVEPVLRRLWFEPSRSWLGFSLHRTTPLPKPALPRGFKIRQAAAADIGDLVRLDRAAFPNTPMPDGVMRARFEEGSAFVAVVGSSVGGFALYERVDDELGYLSVLAVGEAHRGQGIGAALTVHVAKTLFSQGAQQLDLKTDDSNASAIRLYRRLGFRQSLAGRDYSRPTDPRMITKLKKTSEGTLIRFGGWR